MFLWFSRVQNNQLLATHLKAVSGGTTKSHDIVIEE